MAYKKDKKKVLIIDDDADFRELLTYRMRANNFDVLTAAGRKEALSKAKKSPDVILLDVMMPAEKEGYSVLAKLKGDKSTKDIPVIFLTKRVEDREKALKAGCRFFLTKPYEASDLIEKVCLAINGRKEKEIKK